MRVDPQVTAYLHMLVDKYLPGCEFANAHAVGVDCRAASIWRALPDLVVAGELIPRGLFGLMIWIAGLLRGDLARGSGPPARRPAIEEGQPVGWLFDPYIDPEGVWIERVDEGREVVLKGGHRYAEYVVNLYLQDMGARTLVYSATRANFSRTPLGRLYVQGVHLFHDPLLEWYLGRLKVWMERKGRAAGS